MHWCEAQNTSANLGSGAVYDGKEVRMRADWLKNYSEPTWFEVHEEAFFLRKLMRRLGNRWHPMSPFVTETKTPGITQSRDTWKVMVSKVAKQSSYYFTDDQRNRSGRLMVSDATHWVTHSGVVVDELHGETSAHGVALGATVSGHAGKTTIVHGTRATKDPRLVIDVLTPNADGPLSLARHVQRLLLEKLYPDERRYAEDYPNAPADLTLDAVIEAADGYLEPRAEWWPTVSRDDDSDELLVVDEFRSAEIFIDIPDFLFNTTIRTAYALRLTDVENQDNFVISDIVLIDTDGDSVRIRG